jgi:hypothetical protein
LFMLVDVLHLKWPLISRCMLKLVWKWSSIQAMTLLPDLLGSGIQYCLTLTRILGTRRQLNHPAWLRRWITCCRKLRSRRRPDSKSWICPYSTVNRPAPLHHSWHWLVPIPSNGRWILILFKLGNKWSKNGQLCFKHDGAACW